MTSAIEIRDLAYHYKSNWSFKRRSALTPFSLDVAEGESFGFLGHNGAGKTTTIKCILNLINPTGGSIKLFGMDHRDPKARLNIGYIPEQPYFYDNLTVRELLTFYGRLAGVHGFALSKKIKESTERAGLSDRSSARLRSLSKGLMQRVALAQALLTSPRLLILDEPFSGLDPIGRREFRTVFHELSQSGTTLFISSHVLPDVEFLCNKVSILANGELKGVFNIKDLPARSGGYYELVVKGDPDVARMIGTAAARIEEHAEGIRFEFGSKPEAEKALRTALERELSVESYHFIRKGLEDLFVQLVQGEGHV